MKDFMMIFIGPDYGDLGLSPDKIQERMGKWWAWHEKMEKAGIIRDGNALEAKIKRISGRDKVVTDLASTEVKELVGGYYVIRVKDFDAAVEEAKNFPDFDLNGTVEVREVMVFDQQ